MRCIVPLLMIILLSASLSLAEPICTTLPNGLRLITVPNFNSKLVTIDLLIDASSLDEPFQLQGVRQVLLRSMLQGLATGNALDSPGGSMEGHIYQDAMEIRIKAPTDSIQAALDKLLQAVTRPTLPEEGVKAAIAQSQHEADIKPTGTVDLAFYYSQALLYENHPYETEGKGTSDTLARLTPEIVSMAYKLFIRPENSYLAIVGNGISEKISQDIETKLAEWKRSQLPGMKRYPVDEPALTGSQLRVREESVQNSCVMMTFPVAGCTQSDFLGLRLIEALLSGGTGSRLFKEVREKQKLAYEVSTRLPITSHDSSFSVYALTDGRSLEKTKAALITVLAQLQTEKVSRKELERAKAYLKGKSLLEHQTSAQYAFNLAWDELIGLGASYDEDVLKDIDALSEDDILRIAGKYFTHYYLVLVIPNTLVQPDR